MRQRRMIEHLEAIITQTEWMEKTYGSDFPEFQARFRIIDETVRELLVHAADTWNFFETSGM